MSDSVTDLGDTGRTSRVVKIVATIVLVVLLLLSCWISFWPLPARDSDAGRGSIVRSRASGAIAVGDVEVELIDDLDLGPKGRAVRVSCTLEARSSDIIFDSSSLALIFDTVRIMPVVLEGRDAATWVSYPHILKRGTPERVAAVFAAPAGSQEATFAVQFPDVTPLDTVEMPVRFSEAAEKR